MVVQEQEQKQKQEQEFVHAVFPEGNDFYAAVHSNSDNFFLGHELYFSLNCVQAYSKTDSHLHNSPQSNSFLYWYIIFWSAIRGDISPLLRWAPSNEIYRSMNI